MNSKLADITVIAKMITCYGGEQMKQAFVSGRPHSSGLRKAKGDPQILTTFSPTSERNSTLASVTSVKPQDQLFQRGVIS